MLHSKFSIKELFSTNQSDSSNHKFKTLPMSELIDINKSKTSCSGKGLNHSGIYIFWWTGTKVELEGLNKQIRLKGKVNKDATPENLEEKHHFHNIEFSTKWFPELEQQRYALYVGKSTNIENRLRWHLKVGTTHNNWKKAQNEMPNKGNFFPVYSPTTSCQFRSGIELLVKDKEFSEEQFWNYVKENISFSYLTFHNPNLNEKQNEKDLFVAERFYLEDYLIGTLRPWFNIDSER